MKRSLALLLLFLASCGSSSSSGGAAPADCRVDKSQGSCAAQGQCIAKSCASQFAAADDANGVCKDAIACTIACNCETSCSLSCGQTKESTECKAAINAAVDCEVASCSDSCGTAGAGGAP